jgi:hypothetical protein
MNPTVDRAFIAAEYEKDEAVAAAEYGAEFRRDIEAFVAREAVEARIIPGRRELPPIPGCWPIAFVDPSGGSQDSMTLAIAHREGDRAVLDVLRERRPPFSPEAVVEEFAALLKAYGCHTVTGDRYGGEWPRERFGAHGIMYRVADRPKGDLYRDLLPLLNSGTADLLDDRRLVAQLCGLERRTARGGRDSIDHGPGRTTTSPTRRPVPWCWPASSPPALVWPSLTWCLPPKTPEEWAELERKHRRELWHGDRGWT